MNPPTFLIAAIAALVLTSTSSYAGNFGVSPLDVQFGPGKTSAVLTVTNDDKKPLSMRVRAMSWTQNPDGTDVYTESSDLVFFPKRLDLRPGEERVVRVALPATPAGPERAYRLYIDELPPAQTPSSEGSKLAVLVSIGVPVFVSPTGASGDLQVEKAEWLRDGVLALSVRNAGTSRVRMSRLADEAGTTVTDALPARYVFPGVNRVLSLPLGSSLCKSAGQSLRIESDGGLSQGSVPVPRCAS